MDNKSNLILGACIALGLIVLGIFINKGLQSFSNKERVVTVKGLAEQDVKADNATIVIDIRFTSDDPKSIVSAIDSRVSKISEYLRRKGYGDIKVSNLNLFDSKSYYEQKWKGGRYVDVKKDRYSGSKDIRIDIKDVETAGEISNTINIDLINNNLSSDVNCSYQFPELNSIKPKLIEESTKNARIAGEQFAKDSKSKLGKIKTASQGQISLAGQFYSEEDAVSDIPNEPYIQKARVVSTIVFFLED